MNTQLILLTLSVMLLSACGGTSVLKANFQSDPYNAPPNASLPDAPVGDSLRLVPPHTNLVKLWTSTPPNNGSKAVQISSEPMGFHGIELIPSNEGSGERYLLTFMIRPNIVMNNRNFFIRARISPFDSGLIAEIKLNNGKVYAKNSGQYQLLSDVEYDLNGNMAILFSVDFAKNVYNALITSEGNGQDNIKDAPIANGLSSDGIYFQVGFDGESSSGLPGIFVADNFAITRYND